MVEHLKKSVWRFWRQEKRFASTFKVLISLSKLSSALKLPFLSSLSVLHFKSDETVISQNTERFAVTRPSLPFLFHSCSILKWNLWGCGLFAARDGFPRVSAIFSLEFLELFSITGCSLEIWTFVCFQVPIKITENLDPLTLLTDNATVAQWNNENLPSDRMSTENATILTNCERWPLMIDPQLQGVKWIKTREGEELRVVRLGQKGFVLPQWSVDYWSFFPVAISTSDAISAYIRDHSSTQSVDHVLTFEPCRSMVIKSALYRIKTKC